MSFRVLVIPEDPTWNGYILTPLTKALLADAGKPKAVVKLLENPRLRGYAHALRAIRDESIPLLCCPAQPEVEIYACVGFRFS